VRHRGPPPNLALQPTAGKRRLPVPSSLRSSAAAELARQASRVDHTQIGLAGEFYVLAQIARRCYWGRTRYAGHPLSFRPTRSRGSPLATSARPTLAHDTLRVLSGDRSRFAAIIGPAMESPCTHP
jgi:hypothetical protein